jgi:hypothetical protein
MDQPLEMRIGKLRATTGNRGTGSENSY